MIAHLVIWESDKNKHFENPGAIDLFNKFADEYTGIPFWLIYDKNEEHVANSLDSKGKNVGCPANEHEVEVFLEILKKHRT